MTTSIIRPELVDMCLENGKRYETYLCSETIKSLERIFNYIETYKTGHGDRETVGVQGIL